MEHRLRVTLHDGRYIIGTFLAFDKHLNLVLSESEEFRLSKAAAAASRSAVVEERTEKRTLGLILIRGENVVSLAVEGPPPPSAAQKALSGPPGPGQAVRGAGRGVVVPPGGAAPPVGLGAAPVHGMGLPPPPPPPPGGMGRGGGGPPPGY